MASNLPLVRVQGGIRQPFQLSCTMNEPEIHIFPGSESYMSIGNDWHM